MLFNSLMCRTPGFIGEETKYTTTNSLEVAHFYYKPKPNQTKPFGLVTVFGWF